MRKLITTDSHLVPPPWLLQELPKNGDLTGIAPLLWGNDYPHAEGVYPDSQAYVEKQFAGVPDDEVDAMTYGTAKELFGFTV